MRTETEDYFPLVDAVSRERSNDAARALSWEVHRIAETILSAAHDLHFTPEEITGEFFYKILRFRCAPARLTKSWLWKCVTNAYRDLRRRHAWRFVPLLKDES